MVKKELEPQKVVGDDIVLDKWGVGLASKLYGAN